jgi:ABC-type bacteriocin/lantibiotic exporter with double-glycine peptidase domain
MRFMKPYVTVLWEIVLILASVLIFRGAWLILDRVIPSNEFTLLISLFLGVILASISLFFLTKQTKR